MRAVIAMLVIVAGVLVAAQQAPQLPAPFATESANNAPRVVEAPAGARLQVPQGFTVQMWAAGFDTPRFMLLAPGGEILLSDSGSGTVYVFARGNGADRRSLITGLSRPYGLAFWQNYLYVAETDSVKRYPYDAQALTAGPGQEVVKVPGGGNHWTRAIVFDRAGQKMYVSVGSSSNIAPDPEERAAINRYNPDGSAHEIYAAGTRNPSSIHWYPNSDTLWATVIERDGLGDNLPPDYFTHVQQSGFYGWPWAYFGPHAEPRHNGQHPELVQKTITPDVALPAHNSPLDFAFYTGTQFPAEYRGGAFITLHGTWNRSQRAGYKVVYVPFQNGRPAGAPKDFLTGWMIAPANKDVWGRPVGVVTLSDGSLLVSDDGGKKIWRVAYGGQPAAGSRQ
ncbi:MAG TPA: PQQ-dependent sugar dehydrogenase [Vicinamibacterales bacterium]|jgi:glucose/arabinose dehydrogenase|nr:PQQ-dependent sugar dehydrogenase [Vicinamibacterales bacterium]